jgi:hypothetical protein
VPVNHKKLTLIDAGVLIAAPRGDSEQSKKAVALEENARIVAGTLKGEAELRAGL